MGEGSSPGRDGQDGRWTDETDNSLLVTKTQLGEEDTTRLQEETEGS